MSHRAPLSSLSSLALDVWRFGLDGRQANTLLLLERVERATGLLIDPKELSRAVRELEAGRWAVRGMLGFRRVPEHCEQEAALLPLKE